MPFAYRNIVIFITGAIVLGLEVLASRIMTPYFGVSLYIWAGILTITLICLAWGYRMGGRWAHQGKDLDAAFARLLGLAALCLPLAAFAYPLVLPGLARMDLVMGSFIAGALLMAVPLVALSALNPILVAMSGDKGGDAGAGKVFFVSTLGSVAGVLITAFVLIPGMSNRAGLLTLGGVLALLAVAEAVPVAGRAARLPGAALGALAAIAVLLVWLTLPGVGRVAQHLGERWHLVDERHSLFGSVKVIDVEGLPQGSGRLFFQDGLPQGMHDRNGHSLFAFDHMLEKLIRSARPDARRALVVGLGAGTVPRRLHADGLMVEVVEINPQALPMARQWFGFPEAIPVHTADARTFVAACPDRYDAVVLDAFHGDGIPTHLLTVEFFDSLAACAAPEGAVAINSFRDSNDTRSFDALVASLKAAFRNVVTFTQEDDLTNAFLLASNGPLPGNYTGIAVDDAPNNSLRIKLRAYLASARTVRELRGATPVHDDENTFPILYAEAFLRFRRDAVHWAPPEMLW